MRPLSGDDFWVEDVGRLHHQVHGVWPGLSVCPRTSLVGAEVIHESCIRYYVLGPDAELPADDIPQLCVDFVYIPVEAALALQFRHDIIMQLGNRHEFGCMRVGYLYCKVILNPHDKLDRVETHLLSPQRLRVATPYSGIQE